MGRRSSYAGSASNYARTRQQREAAQAKSTKREFGLCDIFAFKMCGCFSSDELPPPDPHAVIYQAHGKSSSSNFTMTTSTSVTPNNSRTNSPGKVTAYTPSTTSSLKDEPTPYYDARRLSGRTGVEHLAYRRPPPEPASPTRPPVGRTVLGNTPYRRPLSDEPKPLQKRLPDVEISKGPARAPDDAEAPKIAGNVGRLSAMFEQG